MAAPNFFDVFNRPQNFPFLSFFYTTANVGSMLPVYQPIVIGNAESGHMIRYVLLTQLPVVEALPVHRETALLFYSFVNPPLPEFPPEIVVTGWEGSVRVKAFLPVYSPIVVGDGVFGIYFLGYKLTNLVRSLRQMPAASPPPQPPTASPPPQPPAATPPQQPPPAASTPHNNHNPINGF